jgi:hypothetical protein
MWRTTDPMIKSILSVVALCAVIALVGGCNKSNKAASPGAVSDDACCAQKSSCTEKSSSASPGAVGDKATCTKTCPMSGKASTSTPGTEASPGAVSDDAKPGCCKSKSSCTGAAKVDG